jgi:hypothetical protein
VNSSSPHSVPRPPLRSGRPPATRRLGLTRWRRTRRGSRRWVRIRAVGLHHWLPADDARVIGRGPGLTPGQAAVLRFASVRRGRKADIRGPAVEEAASLERGDDRAQKATLDGSTSVLWLLVVLVYGSELICVIVSVAGWAYGCAATPCARNKTTPGAWQRLIASRSDAEGSSTGPVGAIYRR